MGRSLSTAELTTPENSLPNRSQGMAKAAMPEKAAQETVAELSGLIKGSIRSVHGKQAVAAVLLRKTEGNLSRDIDSGAMRMADVAALGPEVLVAFARGVLDRWGELATPQARLRTKARELRDMASELDQLAEYVA